MNSSRLQSTTKFTVTPHLCLAINNIDYVLQFIKPFVQELGIDESIKKMEISNGEIVARLVRGGEGRVGGLCLTPNELSIPLKPVLIKLFSPQAEQPSIHIL